MANLTSASDPVTRGLEALRHKLAQYQAYGACASTWLRKAPASSIQPLLRENSKKLK